MFANIFKKKQETKIQQPGLWQSFTSSITNLRYDAFKHYYEIKEKVFEPDEDQKQKFIVIQGKKYPNRREAKKVVKNILWFSYRKGFKISQTYKSDVGWGCLIRVGQMALASGLLNFFQSDPRIRQYLSHQSILNSLINAFSDFKGIQQKYSLNILIQIANEWFMQKPGQWFDMTKISHCLQVAQNKRPMRGTQNLQVVFFDQSINIPKIFKIELLKQCGCVKKNIVCEKCHSQVKPSPNEQILTRNKNGQFQSVLFKQESTERNMKKQKIKFADESIGAHNSYSNNSNNLLWIFRNRRLKRDLLLLVLTRVDGDHRNVQRVNSAIFSLLDLKLCLGIMTGFPGKAIFVVGRQENKLIYLNPHYVQQNERIECSKSQSYHCQQYLLTDRTQLDPTMNFCFYIQTIGDLQLLAKTIHEINHRYQDTLSIGVDFYNLFFDSIDFQEDQQQSIDCKSNFYDQI